MEGEWRVAPSDKFCLNKTYDHDGSTIYKLVSVYRAAATLGSMFEVSKVNIIFIIFQDETKDFADKVLVVPESSNEVSNLVYNIDGLSVKNALNNAALGHCDVRVTVTETKNVRVHTVTVAGKKSSIRHIDKFIKDNSDTASMKFAGSVSGPVRFMAVASAFSALTGRRR